MALRASEAGDYSYKNGVLGQIVKFQISGTKEEREKEIERLKGWINNLENRLDYDRCEDNTRYISVRLFNDDFERRPDYIQIERDASRMSNPCRLSLEYLGDRRVDSIVDRELSLRQREAAHHLSFLPPI